MHTPKRNCIIMQSFFRSAAPLVLWLQKCLFCQDQRASDVLVSQESTNKCQTLCSRQNACWTLIKIHTVVCAGDQDCSSSETLTGLSGSGHVPDVCSAVKSQGTVFLLRGVSQLLSSIWPQSEQLNETLLPLEQWGAKSPWWVEKGLDTDWFILLKTKLS